MFKTLLKDSDPAIYGHIEAELARQNEHIELIASENIVSKAVMQAQGSVLTNKYAEGYPGKRYYGGCECVDEVEKIAIDRVTQLFGCKFANVQPHSGSQANQAVYFSLLQAGDTVLGMALDQGGHLTHGSPVNLSGKTYNVIPYGIDDDGNIDFEEVRRLAIAHKPKMIWTGASAYPLTIDFAKFSEIAKEVGAILFADIAHIAGLVAGGAHPSPFPYADVVTSTTHKTLRGPRGGIILTNNEEIAKKVNKTVFPGYQGGPLMHVIAAKAVAFGEALQPEFKQYAAQVVANAQTLAGVLKQRGLSMVAHGTENHLLMVDLQNLNLSGQQGEDALARVGIICNKNMVRNDPRKAWDPSGIRLGTPAGTTRGFGTSEWQQIGTLIADVLHATSQNNGESDAKVEQAVREQVKELCKRFPIYDEAL